MGKFYQSIQSYGPSLMTKFCSALYLENLLSNIFAKLNLRGGVSCMPAALSFKHAVCRQSFTIIILYCLTIGLSKQYSSRPDCTHMPTVLFGPAQFES